MLVMSSGGVYAALRRMAGCAELLFRGGHNERPKSAFLFLGLEGEESVQDFRISLQPILKFLRYYYRECEVRWRI